MIKPLILQRKWLFGVLKSVQFRLLVFWEGPDWELYVILLQYTEICQVSLHWILCIAVVQVHALKTVLFEHNIRHVGGSLTVHLGAAYRKGCRAVMWHQINPESNSYNSSSSVLDICSSRSTQRLALHSFCACTDQIQGITENRQLVKSQLSYWAENGQLTGPALASEQLLVL